MKIFRLKTPISEKEVKKLRINDIVYLSGTVVTARDESHRRALDFHKKGKSLPIILKGLPIFHCGPIMKNENGEWKVVAAGPTTSTRMEIYEDQFIKNFKIRAVIGAGSTQASGPRPWHQLPNDGLRGGQVTDAPEENHA